MNWFAVSARPDPETVKVSSASVSRSQTSVRATGEKGQAQKAKLTQSSFKWSEMSLYDGRDGRPLYIVVDNIVYDVTELNAYYSPNSAGGDTLAVRSSGLPPYISEDTLQPYKVGVIVA
ncbi:unnamed protein product [Colias eurytheme]|nr:unnamed protein product [Colias eurytheme]